MNAARQLNMPGVPPKPEAARRSRPPATVLILASLKSTGVPMLVEEIAKAAHLPVSTVAARVGELLRAHSVLPVQYRETSTGRGAWAFVHCSSLKPAARRYAEETARQLVRTRGRWKPASPVDQPATASVRGFVIEAEGSDEVVSAAVKLAGEILGT